MSQANVEAIYRMLDAFNARDFDRLLAEFDQEIEFHSRFTPVGGVYRGHDGLSRWHRDLTETWEYLRLQTDRLIEVDDETMVLLLTLYGEGRGSGVEVRQEIAQVHTFRAGKVLRLVTYTDRAEALQAAGLRE